MSTFRALLLTAAAIVVGFSTPFLISRVVDGVMGSGRAGGEGGTGVEVAAGERRTGGQDGKGMALFEFPGVGSRGEFLYRLNCAPCHGADGNGDSAYNAPALAGQKQWYLERQLENFRDGARGSHPEDVHGMQMAPLMRVLGDEQALMDVARYISGMPPFRVEAELGGDIAAGKKVFVGTCLPCHGPGAEGNRVLGAPMLAGQADWYLVRQIDKFQAGIRGAHPSDMTGMQMAAMAKTLVEEETIRDLAAYIGGLR